MPWIGVAVSVDELLTERRYGAAHGGGVIAAGRPTRPSTVIVAGATGILRPAVELLLHDQHLVVAVARNPEGLTNLQHQVRSNRLICLDVDAQGDQLGPLLVSIRNTRRLRYVAALVYGPAVSPENLVVLGDLVTDRLVDILTSGPSQLSLRRDGPLNQKQLDQRRRRLLLGATVDHGKRRWHTPAEISAAALTVMHSGIEIVLGNLDPAELPVDDG